MNTSTNTKLIGHCAVDSGQILLVDPCYIKTDGKDAWDSDCHFVPDADREFDASKGGYSACCAASLSEDGAGQVTICGVAGDGVCTSTGYGDGNYPVYAEYNDEGRIVKVTIDFDPTFED